MIVIADDLTGANDTAIQYRKNGVSAIVKVDVSKDYKKDIFDGYDVVSLNTDSRAMTPTEAYKTVYDACKTFCNAQDRIYKKTDSVLRGNPGAELEAVMEALDYHLAIVAPSYPENDRVLKNGILYAGDKQIDAVKTIAADMKCKVVSVNLSVVREGVQALAKFIAEECEKGTQVFVCDSENYDDLQVIYDASMKISIRNVLCGSAGLALCDAKYIASTEHKELASKPKSTDGVKLVLTGSRNIETRNQVIKASQTFGQECVLLEKQLVIENKKEEAITKCVEQVKSQIENGAKVVFVCVSSLFEDFKMVLKDSAENYSIAYELSDCLGKVAEIIYETFGVSAIVSNGGDTTMQLCRHLSVSGIEPIAEVAPGIPMGFLVGGKANGVPVVTKSGGFGGTDVTVNSLNFLKKGF